MNDTQITNEKIYDLLTTINSHINELRNEVKEVKNTLELQTNVIDGLGRQVANLEKENNKLNVKIQNLEKLQKRNNIIIFGLPENTDKTLLDVVIEFFKHKLNTSLQKADINNIFRIANTARSQDRIQEPRPVVLELVSYLTKKELFRSVNKLKGTGVYISEDLTVNERGEHKSLYKHYSAAKRRGYSAKLYRNKVVINGTSYTFQKLKKTNIDDIEIGKKAASDIQSRKSVGEPTSPIEGIEVFFKTPTQTAADKGEYIPSTSTREQTVNLPQQPLQKQLASKQLSQKLNKMNTSGNKKETDKRITETTAMNVQTRSRSGSKSGIEKITGK